MDPERADGPGIVHVDMDAFFAAVEVLDDPRLAGRPLIVGGEGARGVVASCSYEARIFGVRSAMPSLEARRRCPNAIFRPGRHERYGELSRRIHEVFNRFTPLVEGLALDEAFLDVRGATRLLGPAREVAAAVRAAVLADVGLTCSVGLGTTKLVAKLASEAAKPSADRNGVHPGRGLVVVEKAEELAFLHPLAIEVLGGVGPATSARLRALGITTVGQLAASPVQAVERSVGRAAGRHLHDLACGIDPRRVEPSRVTKSVGHEETYPRDRRDRDGLRREVVKMADLVARRLRRAGLVGRTVQLKVRFADFRTITRSRTQSRAMSTGPAIGLLASALLDAVDIDGGIRLLGVSVSSLAPAGPAPAEQLALGLDGRGTGDTPAGEAAKHARRHAAGLAVEAVRARFGDGALGPAGPAGSSAPPTLEGRGPGAYGPSPAGLARLDDAAGRLGSALL